MENYGEGFRHAYYLENPNDVEKHFLCNINQLELKILVDFLFSEYDIKCKWVSIDPLLNERISWNRTFCYFGYPFMYADLKKCNIMNLTHDLAHVIHMSPKQRESLTITHALRTNGHLSDSRWNGEEENYVTLIQLQLGKFLTESVPNYITLMGYYKYLSGRTSSIEIAIADLENTSTFPILEKYDDVISEFDDEKYAYR